MLVDRATCICGRYTWPEGQCLDGSHVCPHCGYMVGTAVADGGDEPRTYYRDARGETHLTPDEARGCYDDEAIRAADPVQMRPSQFMALRQFTARMGER